MIEIEKEYAVELLMELGRCSLVINDILVHKAAEGNSAVLMLSDNKGNASYFLIAVRNIEYLSLFDSVEYTGQQKEMIQVVEQEQEEQEDDPYDGDPYDGELPADAIVVKEQDRELIYDDYSNMKPNTPHANIKKEKDMGAIKFQGKKEVQKKKARKPSVISKPKQIDCTEISPDSSSCLGTGPVGIINYIDLTKPYGIKTAVVCKGCLSYLQGRPSITIIGQHYIRADEKAATNKDVANWISSNSKTLVASITESLEEIIDNIKIAIMRSSGNFDLSVITFEAMLDSIEKSMDELYLQMEGM